MVIGVDYDDTLTDLKVVAFVKKALREKHDVWVITKRSENDALKEWILKELLKIGIHSSKVIFTNRKSKVDAIKALNCDLFIDNDSTEFSVINNFTNALALNFQKS
jgi:uncharacterized HAD superfamily protein